MLQCSCIGLIRVRSYPLYRRYCFIFLRNTGDEDTLHRFTCLPKELRFNLTLYEAIISPNISWIIFKADHQPRGYVCIGYASVMSWIFCTGNTFRNFWRIFHTFPFLILLQYFWSKLLNLNTSSSRYLTLDVLKMPAKLLSPHFFKF